MTRSPWIAWFVLSALALLIWIGTANQVSFQAQADEGVYLYYASRVSERGPAVFPPLLKEYVENSAVRQYFPTPLRVFTLAADAAAFRAVGGFLSLQLVSMISFLMVLALVFVGVRSWFGTGTAFFTGLLLAVSPIWLAMSRRALSDAWSGFWMTAAVMGVIALLVRRNRSVWKWAGLGGLFAAAILSRESAIVLLPMAWTCLLFFQERDEKAVYGMAVATAAALALVAVVWFLLFRDPGAVYRALAITAQSVKTNTYAQQYGGGPWFRPILDAMLLSPGTVLLFIAGLGFYQANPAETISRRVADLWVILWLSALIFFCAGTRNIRYLLFLEVPYRLGAVLFLRQWKVRWPVWGKWAAGFCFGALILLDLLVFYRFFVLNGLYDPETAFLIRQYGLLP